MEDNKDKSNRLNYLQKEFKRQADRKEFYLKEIKEIKIRLQANEKEITDNRGWIKFHKNSIKEHKKEISTTSNLDNKKDQENKVRFHEAQINKHHNKNIQYHNKEIISTKEEIGLFQKGIKRCNEQLIILKNRISENNI